MYIKTFMYLVLGFNIPRNSLMEYCTTVSFNLIGQQDRVPCVGMQGTD